MASDANKQQRETLEARRFQLLVEAVTDYALYMLDPSGVVVNWNTGAQRLKGYSAAEIVGQHFSRFYTPEDRNAGLPARVLETATREGRYEAEGQRVRKDGTVFWANVVVDAIRDDQGKLVGFAKITRDITERREAQLALQETQAERARIQKMEAVGKLTGGVAHDFNNLLTIITGYVQILKKLVGDNPRGQRAAEAIETAVLRGEALTRQLLSFSRRQLLKPVVSEAAPLIDDVRPMIESSLGGLSKLAVALPPDLWRVNTDANEFGLALLNLALNARDAMPRGGTLRITAENVLLRARDMPQKLTGEFVAITVSDTGTGIPNDILQRVFDPFFTTKPPDKGSGLGLSQVHGFAHQSGGTVTIDSELGQGTRITLYLPRATQAVADEEAEPEPPSAAGSTILLVEDNPEVAAASIVLLEELGYTVQPVGSAEAALQALGQLGVDAVVSDIVMAGAMDGLGLAQEIRQNHPDLPILLVTGYSEAAALAGTDFPVLRKPFQLAELGRALARVMAPAPAAPDNLVRLRIGRSAGRKPAGG